MNALHDLLIRPFVERLGWTLVHFLWEGLLVAAAAMGLALLVLPRAAPIAPATPTQSSPRN